MWSLALAVGPDNIKVEAVKFVLKAASPVFETEFDEKWENGVVTDDNGIPLPDLDPTAFQLFVNLLILDAWSVESLKSLKLSPNNLLNLLGLCRRYEITKAVENLEKAAEEFIQSFYEFKDTEEFLETSRENLETIFSFESISLNEKEIFESACRWADNQCTIKGLEPTGENYREVLGGCLFQIRFPTMSNEEFTDVGIVKKNILKVDEQLAIYVFIGLNIDRKANYDKTQLQFKTDPRVAVKSSRSNSEEAQHQITTNPREVNIPLSLFGYSVLSLAPQFQSTTSLQYICNGSEKVLPLLVNQKISLHGFGFLGPIDGDANFEVTIQIKRMDWPSYTFDSGTFKKNILAQKGKIFHFLLDEPIVVESRSYTRSWLNRYDIFFWVKGANNILKIPKYKVNSSKDELLAVSGVQFYLHSHWKNANPLTDLLFKKI